MKLEQSIKVAVDVVIFGYESNQLYILLIKQKFGKYKGQWSLPGGFVKNDEGLRAAADRELYEEAGIQVKELEQLYTFGNVDRDPRGRVVSVAYFGLIHPEGHTLEATTDAEPSFALVDVASTLEATIIRSHAATIVLAIARHPLESITIT